MLAVSQFQEGRSELLFPEFAPTLPDSGRLCTKVETCLPIETASVLFFCFLLNILQQFFDSFFQLLINA